MSLEGSFEQSYWWRKFNMIRHDPFHNEGAAEVNDLSPHDVLARGFLERCLLLDRIDWWRLDIWGWSPSKCLLMSDRYTCTQGS